MRTYVVAPMPTLEWKGILSVFCAAFAAFWLAIEPMGFFGLIPQQAGLSGVIGYFAMVVGAACAVAVYVWGYRWMKIFHLPFISLTVTSASDGISYSIRAAANMQAGEFVHRFLHILAKGPARQRVELFRSRYIPVLQVQRDGALVDIDGGTTLSIAGLRDGDVCQVRAEPNPIFKGTLFSRRG